MTEESAETLGSGRLPERIRLHVEGQINAAVLKPGQPIDERALAEQFGTSRTPVREALLVLQDRGLVDIVPRSGIQVHRPTAEELVAMMEALGELEGVLARLAALRADDVQRHELAQALATTADCADRKDSAAYESANAVLHAVIYRASANPFIVEQAQRVRLRIAAYRGRLFEKPGRLKASQQEHVQVVEAILAGDAVAAAEAMRDHISAGGRLFADLVLRSGVR